MLAFNNLHQFIIQNIANFGLSPLLSKYLSFFLIFLLVSFLACLANFFFKKIIVRFIKALILKSKISWDDVFFNEGVFNHLAHVAPAFVFLSLAGFIFPHETTFLGFKSASLALFIKSISKAFIIYFVACAVSAFLDAGLSIYQKNPASKDRPIKAYLQVAKILISFISLIFIISVIFNKSPWALLSGLGALTAVLMLVFKDSIIGFVSSIHLAANKMVRAGDWIEVPKYSADGEVMDVSLTTVKIRNWDKTISTVPTYSLISDSFKNWRGMSESGGRRIKRAIYIDPKTVKFCDENMLENLSKFNLLKEHILNKKNEILKEAKDKGINDTLNQRRLTNLGVFRAYVEAYIKGNANLHQKEMSLLVRQLAQSPEKGLGIEVYAFSKIQLWKEYEDIQADIFDHLIAVLNEFELEVYSYQKI